MRGHNIFKYGIGFILGVILTFFATQYSYFKFEDELNVIDTIAIFVNIGLAYAISRVLEKKKTEDRVEKDIIIEKVKQVITIASKINLENDKIRFDLANSTFRELSVELSSIEKMIEYVELKIDAKKFDEIKLALREYKKLVTNQTVSNEFLNFDNFASNRVVLQGRNFKQHLFKIIIDCNRV